MLSTILPSGSPAPTREATYSPAEVAEAWGVSVRTVRRLIALGRAHRGLSPTAGGLWPVIRPGPRCVRIPAAAMARHLAHMERLAAMPRPIRLNG